MLRNTLISEAIKLQKAIHVFTSIETDHQGINQIFTYWTDISRMNNMKILTLFKTAAKMIFKLSLILSKKSRT